MKQVNGKINKRLKIQTQYHRDTCNAYTNYPVRKIVWKIVKCQVRKETRTNVGWGVEEVRINEQIHKRVNETS